MKPIKMFGLAALAALMAMAFIGVSSATAEPAALCAADAGEEAGEEECEQITHVHDESVGKAKLLSSINIECNVLFLGDEEEESETPVEIEGAFTYTNCGSCTVEEENGPSTIKLLYTGHETGEVTGELLLHVECTGFIDCSYNGAGLKGTAKGSLLSTQKNGEITISGQTLNKEAGGFLCPKTTKLDITLASIIAFFLRRPLCIPGNLYAVAILGRVCLVNIPGFGTYKQVFDR